MMEENIVKDFAKKVHDDLYAFLLHKDTIDAHLPQCPDVEEKWKEVAAQYLPDGIREYQEYPVTSLGWMMFMGMAMAWYWDTDWEKYSNRKDFYTALRDEAGYDNFDETVIHKVLGYSGEKEERISAFVAECASRVYNLLSHSHIEPGSEMAFKCYVAALQQLYMMGMCVELNALGYHMTPYHQASLN